jgi:uncharacterized protein (UPF0333 family)
MGVEKLFMTGKKGQITTEYVIIVGFMLVILLVLWAQTTFTISSTTADLRVAYAKHAVTKIAEAADAVYVQGPPAKFSIYVTIPDNVENSSVSGHEVSISVYTYGGTTDVYQETLGTMRGCINHGVPGTHRISVEAVEVGSTNMIQVTDGETICP